MVTLAKLCIYKSNLSMNKNAKIQRKVQEEPIAMQRKENAGKTMAPPAFSLSSSPVQKKEESKANAGAASKLPEDVRGKMEQSMGMDFSNVNIHANSEKAVSAGALAYSQGTDIHFAPGQYDPTSQKGQELLGHELAHTKQQAEGRVKADGEVAGMPLNADKGLEREADEMAQKAVVGAVSPKTTQAKKGAGEGNAPVQAKKATHDSNAPVQRFKMREEDISRYPKFADFVANQMPSNIHDPRLVHYLNVLGENTGENKRDIRSDLSWGNGPEIHPFSLSANKVSFASNAGSEIIRLSRADIQGFENNETDQQKFHKLVLESNILNGYTQFLDDQDGKDFYGKEGKLLEKAEFGKDIETVWDAKDARRGKFGSGEWEMTVESAQGPNPQRIRLWNSSNADGAYDAKPGTKIAVQSGAHGDWLIRTQYLPEGKNPAKDGDYKNAEMLTNKIGKDTYMVRSEHTGDGDRQDLVLKVTKKSNKGSK
jgi:hypothetical protein